MNALTKEQIAAATPRELDALIAEHLYGWTELRVGVVLVTGKPPGKTWRNVQRFSTTGDGMLNIMRALWGLGLRCLIRHTPDGEYFTEIFGSVGGSSKLSRLAEYCAVEASESVCRAALLAILAQQEAEI